MQSSPCSIGASDLDPRLVRDADEVSVAARGVGRSVDGVQRGRGDPSGSTAVPTSVGLGVK